MKINTNPLGSLYECVCTERVIISAFIMLDVRIPFPSSKREFEYSD